MNLIVCCDGTWNGPKDLEGGQPSPTNVYKIFNALAEVDRNGKEQKKYYHPGIGTEGRFWQRTFDGATGQGLDRNIKAAYNWLARNYTPGDNIFLFGFSRGAYTVRSLGGMISKCGLLAVEASSLKDDEVRPAIEAIFLEYRDKSTNEQAIPQQGDRHFHNVQPGCNRRASTAVHFIGVWDTVGSRGIPDTMGITKWIFDRRKKHSFHNTKLGPAIKNARHAVAADEYRQGFMPTMWEEPEDWKGNLEQVWFPGVHGDVGGGYTTSELSNQPLLWMMEEAESFELVFHERAREQLGYNPHGVMHDSLTGIFSFLKTRPRAIPEVMSDQNTDISCSMKKRHGHPSLAQGPYRPIRTLPFTAEIFARDKWNDTGIFLEKGRSYSFVAAGEWRDWGIVTDADGKPRNRMHPFLIGWCLGSLIGKVEHLFRWMLSNDQIDFPCTRREENFPWFSLVGVIANNEPPPIVQAQRDNHVQKLPHEVFLIGTSVTHTPKADGYLYCFANDAWLKYGNNRGSVKLTVSASSPQQTADGAIAPAAQSSTPAS